MNTYQSFKISLCAVILCSVSILMSDYAVAQEDGVRVSEVSQAQRREARRAEALAKEQKPEKGECSVEYE